MNFENSKISAPHKILLNLLDKINLKRNGNLLYQILAYTIHEKMKLLGSTKITNNANGENVPCLKMTEVVLVHYNIVNNDYQ